MRLAKLDSSDVVKFQNGFFLSADYRGEVRVWDRDGSLKVAYKIKPHVSRYASMVVDDAVILKDGSVIASILYQIPHDSNRYVYLYHYDEAGNFREQVDLGLWRALKICAAEDKSIWTFSNKEQYGIDVDAPAEGILRNYRFGSGLLRSTVLRSNLPDKYPNHRRTNNAIACSGTSVHALTSAGQWIDYSAGSDSTITQVEPFTTPQSGSFWQMAGFAYLDQHVYGLMHSVPGDPVWSMLVELLPNKDGTKLQWVEVPPEKTIPANNAVSGTSLSAEQSAGKRIVLMELLGTDSDEGRSLVYRTSLNDSVVWSEPRYAAPR